MFKVAALYKFVSIEEPADVKNKLQRLCELHNVLGTMIVASEGINGTVSTSEEEMSSFLEQLVVMDTRLGNIDVKYSTFDRKPFYHLRIALKKEIVTLGVDCSSIESQQDKIHDLEPSNWNDIISQEDVIVIDARNDYEVSLGTFENALDPRTKSFREFPSAVERLSQSAGIKKKIAMFCTGGIRCDKVAPYLSSLPDIDEIYTLKGGILKYLEEVPKEDSKWQGECFVFDQRVTVTHGLQPGSSTLCRGCRHPLKSDESVGEEYREGVHCKYCVSTLTREQIQAAMERQRQIQLGRERNMQHLGAKYGKRRIESDVADES